MGKINEYRQTINSQVKVKSPDRGKSLDADEYRYPASGMSA
ncbi:hypothetical protein M23134_00876 [Microscilla marina ATCC 23134]|uniref:Uncharacterized protein n=1 Tax=Microscilla marina ATCC 23134 TaxID=313606 RepID=A1ZUN6_MICM2|nr:hypothetical protein M23134_00876 [Microscilla marina ATCC 23134]